MTELKTVAQIRIDFKDRILSTQELEKLLRDDIREAKKAGAYVYPEVLPELEHCPKEELKSDLAGYLESLHWDAFFTTMAAPKQENYVNQSDGSRVLLQHTWRSSGQAMDATIGALMGTKIMGDGKKVNTIRLRPTKVFIAAEQYRIAGWHCHGLLEFPETKHSDAMVGFQRANLSPLGFNRVNVVWSKGAASMYVSKYAAKDAFHGDWRMTGRKKFWQPGYIPERVA